LKSVRRVRRDPARNRRDRPGHNGSVVEFAAITPELLAARIARRACECAGWVVVAADGPDAAEPVAFAQRIAEQVRAQNRPADVVSLHDYVRPASLRFEHGRDDETSYRTGWFDYVALGREVLAPFRGRGGWLPALWDERTDRSARARLRQFGPHGVLIVAGPMLLGRGLDFDVAVALRMSDAAQRRRLPPDQWFTVAAVRAHERGLVEEPDFLVAWNHPDRPAARC
jgi:hypothetical protein